MLKIDGSFLEGGGQIVRSAVALSAVTGIPIRITRIREKRKQPGLRYQHCAAVRAVASACAGHTEGNEPGSSLLSFIPMDIRETDSIVRLRIEEEEWGLEISDKKADCRFQVRHPPQSGWLDEWALLKGARPINPNVALKRAFVA